MRTFYIISTFITLTLLTSFDIKPKVSFIYIDRELDLAKNIQVIQVYGYTDTSMLYGITNSKDTQIIKSKRGKFLNLTGAKKLQLKQVSLEPELAGNWPDVGETVLMVKDTTNSVRVFAFKIDNYYRFWDPNSIPFANSIFLIPKKIPYKRLPVCLQVLDNTSEYWTCTDGCLVEVKSMKERN